MTYLVVLVEGQCEKPVLDALLDKLDVPRNLRRVITHDGIGDLRRNLPKTLRVFCGDEHRVLVLRDSDGGDCVAQKRELEVIIRQSGDLSRCKARIACHELEAWFLGDPAALVSAGFLGRSDSPRILNRNPDEVTKPSEAVLRLKRDENKIFAARRIAPHLDPDRNRSASFRHTIAAIRHLTA